MAKGNQWCRPGEHDYGKPTTIKVAGVKYVIKICKICGYKYQRYA